MNQESRIPREGLSLSVEREFSRENLETYAEGCRNVAWRIVEHMLHNDGEHAILLPSRGAVPLFIGALTAMQTDNDLKEFDIGEIVLPPLNCFDSVRAPQSNKSKRHQVLIFPFTADMQLEHLGRRPKEEVARIRDDVVDGMRRFGACAVSEFSKPPDQRHGREFNLFLNFIEQVEGRHGISNFYRKMPAVDHLTLLDTVISGRASWTILDEFRKLQSAVNPILVVDRNGERIKHKFNEFITPDTRVDVQRILSEDRGSSLLGVVSTIYPELIRYGKSIGLTSPDYYPLFGSWHSIPQNYIEKEIFGSFIGVIQSAIKREDYEAKRQEFMKTFDKSGGFSDRIKEINPAQMADFEIYNAAKAVRTSSGVYQVYFSESQTFAFLQDIQRK